MTAPRSHRYATTLKGWRATFPPARVRLRDLKVAIWNEIRLALCWGGHRNETLVVGASGFAGAAGMLLRAGRLYPRAWRAGRRRGRRRRLRKPLPVVELKPVSLPDYLNSTDILLRDGQNELTASPTGRWGERLLARRDRARWRRDLEAGGCRASRCCSLRLMGLPPRR